MGAIQAALLTQSGLMSYTGQNTQRQQAISTNTGADPAPVVAETAGVQSGAGECERCASSTQLRYQRSEKTSLMIRTQEGDVVRLRFRVQDRLTASAESLEDGESSLAEISVNARSAVKLAVFVKGDLNADELAAIESVIAKASEMAEAFFSGDADGAFASAADLDVDTQQLAKVALRLRMHEEISYSQTTVSLAGLAAPVQEPAPEPAVIAPAAPESESAEPAAAPLAQPVVADAAEAEVTEGPEEAVAAEAEPVVLDPFAMMRTILDFLTQLIDTFGDGESDAAEPGDTEAASGQITFSLRLRVFQSVISSLSQAESDAESDAESEPGSESAAVATLNDTVDAMAASTEPEFQTVA